MMLMQVPMVLLPLVAWLSVFVFWQDSGPNYDPILTVALALLTFANLAALWLWLRRGLAHIASRRMPRVSSPPTSLPPALAGLVYAASADGWPTAFMGTLMDLAHRGAIRAIAWPPLDSGRTAEPGLPLEDTVGLQFLAEPVAAARHEQALLNWLFGSNRQPGDLTSDCMTYFLESEGKQVEGALRMDMRHERLLAHGRSRASKLLYWSCLYALFFGGLAVAVLGGALWRDMASQMLMLGFAMFTSFYPLAYVAAAVPVLSETGNEQRPAWGAFAAYLRRVAGGVEPPPPDALVDRYLPYAASFGLAGDWARYFAGHPNAYMPAWFPRLAGACRADDEDVRALLERAGNGPDEATAAA